MINIKDFELDEIVSIEEVGRGNTVDISVEGTNMFFLENGIYTHNSGAKDNIITMEAIAEAYEKCFVADFIYTISRTIEDRQSNQGKFFIAKNRNGPDGQIFQAAMDLSRGSIKVFDNQMSWDVASKSADAEQKKKLYKMTQDYMEKIKNDKNGDKT